MGRPAFDPRNRAPSGPRVNERIRIPEVRVIDDAGEMLGVMPTDQAKRMAREKNLDLVEVNPKAMPPVCKIMDFGKFKYEEKKRQREAKKRQTLVEIKEIKLRPKTDDHDVGFKTKHIRTFLEEGNKVKLTVRFRGREITHPETATRQIDAIIDAVKDLGYVEQASRMESRTMTAMLAPRVKPQARGAGEGGPREGAPREGAPREGGGREEAAREGGPREDGPREGGLREGGPRKAAPGTPAVETRPRRPAPGAPREGEGEADARPPVEAKGR